MGPRFLDLGEILRIHHSLIEVYGGSDGVRDMGLLQSAIAMPMAAFGGQFLHEDIFEKAAAYLYHIVKNPPFVDGNKRTGAASAIVFLAVNDVQIANDEDALVELTLGIAEGNVDKQQVASFFRRHARPLGEGE